MPPEIDKIGINPEIEFIPDPRQENVAQHLDALNFEGSLCPVKPSQIYKGALYVMFKKNRVNEDWMSQSAHSFREIIYGLKIEKKIPLYIKWFLFVTPKYIEDWFMKKYYASTKAMALAKILETYQDAKKAKIIADLLYQLTIIFTNIAHHFHDTKRHKDFTNKLKKIGADTGLPILQINNIADFKEPHFEKLVELWENTLLQAKPLQLDLHDKIDSFLEDAKT